MTSSKALHASIYAGDDPVNESDPTGLEVLSNQKPTLIPANQGSNLSSEGSSCGPGTVLVNVLNPTLPMNKDRNIGNAGVSWLDVQAGATGAGGITIYYVSYGADYTTSHYRATSMGGILEWFGAQYDGVIPIDGEWLTTTKSWHQTQPIASEGVTSFFVEWETIGIRFWGFVPIPGSNTYSGPLAATATPTS